ncbi:MAG: pro-sigmaK processing inhibitor BofA family protein [Bacilli bacterium]
MKNVINFLKSFVVAPFILYVFNLMAVGLDLFIPINVFTVVIVGLLKIPGFIMLIIFSIFIF